MDTTDWIKIMIALQEQQKKEQEKNGVNQPQEIVGADDLKTSLNSSNNIDFNNNKSTSQVLPFFSNNYLLQNKLINNGLPNPFLQNNGLNNATLLNTSDNKIANFNPNTPLTDAMSLQRRIFNNENKDVVEDSFTGINPTNENDLDKEQEFLGNYSDLLYSFGGKDLNNSFWDLGATIGKKPETKAGKISKGIHIASDVGNILAEMSRGFLGGLANQKANNRYLAWMQDKARQGRNSGYTKMGNGLDTHADNSGDITVT